MLAAAPAAAEGDVFEFFKSEASVVTASRRGQPVSRAPVAIDVVTAEEIAAYGYQNLWDILRFRAGMDVLEGRSSDGNRVIVSARGFSWEFVTQMQVLIDGRSVYMSFLGAPYWSGLPVQIQDIESVEIVRGPNAALYGSNAALGVVNIITRKPGTAAAGGVAVRGGNRTLASAESAEAGGPFAGLRVSHSFEQAPGNPASDGVGEGNDFLHSNKLNVRGRLTPDQATEVEFMSGASWQTFGVAGFDVDVRATHVHDFQMLRAVRGMDSAGSVEATVSRSELRIDFDRFFVSPTAVRVYEYDAEILHRSAWADERVDSVVGAGWRLAGLYSGQAFAGRPAQQNRVVRGFAHHSVHAADALTLVAGAALEDSRVGGLQPAWQGAALYSPRENHVFRLSYARAPSMPPLYNKYGDFELAGTRFLGNPDLEPQQLSSWETGWTGRAMDGALKSAVSLYYMEIEGLGSGHFQSLAPPVFIIDDNSNRATARGVELSEEYAFAPGRALFANYTFEQIQDDKGLQPTVFDLDLRNETPVHKANIGGRTLLGRGLSAAVLIGYKDAYDQRSGTRGTHREIPRSFRLDARLAWSPRPGWELFVSGQNLLQPYRVEFADGLATPRVYQLGASARFGL